MVYDEDLWYGCWDAGFWREVFAWLCAYAIARPLCCSAREQLKDRDFV
jgi:hypothetical protein